MARRQPARRDAIGADAPERPLTGEGVGAYFGDVVGGETTPPSPGRRHRPSTGRSRRGCPGWRPAGALRTTRTGTGESSWQFRAARRSSRSARALPWAADAVGSRSPRTWPFRGPGYLSTGGATFATRMSAEARRRGRSTGKNRGPADGARDLPAAAPSRGDGASDNRARSAHHEETPPVPVGIQARLAVPVEPAERHPAREGEALRGLSFRAELLGSGRGRRLGGPRRVEELDLAGDDLDP